MPEIVEIPVSNIAPGQNDRKRFDLGRLEDLAASIREHGLAQPVTVRLVHTDREIYQIVAGERRFRAISQILRWPTVPCIVRSMSDEEAAAIMLAENTSRADLDPMEEANAYQVRVTRFGWTYERLAETAGVSVDLVKRRISLLRLAPDIQNLVAHSHLPIGHAEAMTVLDVNRQFIAMRIYQQGTGLTLAQFRHIVGELLAEQSQDSLFGLENFWVQQVQQKELPRRGRHACTGAPTRSDLPPIEPRSSSDTTAALIDRWIVGLLDQGLIAEAAVAGTLYDALVRLNYLTVPPDSVLASRS